MTHYVGIDISKGRLDVDWLGKPVAYNNDAIGVKKLIAALVQLKQKNELEMVVCEATGGYEQRLVRASHEAGVSIHVAHANKVRYFAKSKGLLAKTDGIDAEVLSDYGQLLQPRADTLLLNKTTEKIAQTLKRREQLQADKKRETNRLDKLIDPDSAHSIKEHITWLGERIKELEKRLAGLQQNAEIKQQHALLKSIPAIGDLCAHYLLSSLPELGKLSNKALAALVGVAPFNRDSGNSQAKRFIQGGRSQLRQVLYMSAITAIRCNESLKQFYIRLKVQGKPTKVALIAVVRKLISVANSVLRRGVPWEEVY